MKSWFLKHRTTIYAIVSTLALLIYVAMAEDKPTDQYERSAPFHTTNR